MRPTGGSETTGDSQTTGNNETVTLTINEQFSVCFHQMKKLNSSRAESSSQVCQVLSVSHSVDMKLQHFPVRNTPQIPLGFSFERFAHIFHVTQSLNGKISENIADYQFGKIRKDVLTVI